MISFLPPTFSDSIGALLEESVRRSDEDDESDGEAKINAIILQHQTIVLTCAE